MKRSCLEKKSLSYQYLTSTSTIRQHQWINKLFVYNLAIEYRLAAICIAHGLYTDTVGGRHRSERDPPSSSTLTLTRRPPLIRPVSTSGISSWLGH
ncbi:hypothetical protein U9M48_039663 [Paspalum notatum var. saurae]|uniref:Uncharacterized protein n=1 Tax=Paspalum notatum var. saurae TaxID=547442 RepID=A0AAQ3XCC6_PASNO